MTLDHEVADHIQTITLDRPERLNAFKRESMDDLTAAFDAADADDDVGARVGRPRGAGVDGAHAPDDAAHARRRPSAGGAQDRPPLDPRLRATADAKEGATAFPEKRSPHFENRVSHDVPAFFPWKERPPG